MGAIPLNDATKGHSDSWRDNAQIASDGWAKLTPVNAAAIGAHLVGTSGLLAANASRVATQPGVAALRACRSLTRRLDLVVLAGLCLDPGLKGGEGRG
ncbi:hypothetical protein ACFY04_43420, partial [Streptomyces sp. NPDC001549]